MIIIKEQEEGEYDTRKTETQPKNQNNKEIIVEEQEEGKVDAKRNKEEQDVKEGQNNEEEEKTGTMVIYEPNRDEFEMLNELPIVINEEEKVQLRGMPSVNEVKETVVGLNNDSAKGPDGMTRAFYQQTWDITGEDIYSMFKAFFGEAELLRIIHERLKAMLSKIIFPKQAEFVQGRSIAENVLLVQEIIAEIRKKGKPPNLIIKLDMMKAYDKVEWIFMTKVEVRTMQMITDTLKRYEDNSGQKINKEKSVIYMHYSVIGREAVITELCWRERKTFDKVEQFVFAKKGKGTII
ncbi:uncharacterized protein LOC129887346 [Solanum dulcamara]|uniref:uncharacterized protein LOC129887346 n=1 Tax=Solanum dulcamara TaxID=45834 RepID=UPI00248653F2|nr:uncharacterized protein LOC129887346 [Solanum dulcamara]